MTNYRKIYIIRYLQCCSLFSQIIPSKLYKIKIQLSCANPDLLMSKLKDRSYEYITGYLDTMVCCSKDPEKIIEHLETIYTRL